MEVDNEQFYDEISSFLPQPGDYDLEDLEDIIRSTDSHLDASLDINAFITDFGINLSETSGVDVKTDNYIQHSIENDTQKIFQNDCHFNISTFPSPATSIQSSAFSPSCDRTSTPTSLDGDTFNPDDFINFFNDDDIKKENSGSDIVMDVNENCRNTPSPTDSYASSSGSSTSGVQSDISSVASMAQNSNRIIRQEWDIDLSEFIKLKSDVQLETNKLVQEPGHQLDNTPFVIKEEEELQTTSSITSSALPITVPLVPVTQRFQPINVIQGTIIPIQAVSPVVNIKAPVAIKTEDKLPSDLSVASQPIRLVTAATNSVKDPSSKVTSPPNTKPKTIYLSSNDFKTLMQKMNGSGKKPTASNDQNPKIIMKTASGKVIAANKITHISRGNAAASTTSSTASTNNSFTKSATPLNGQSHQFPSKVVKASGPIMFSSHQPSKGFSSNMRSFTAMSPVKSTISHTKNGRADFSLLKSITDDKLLKKQLRMLKNRESASLSRRKKKEYVERLENRISNLEKENCSLKGENSSLRSQLMAFAQTCNCNSGNVSEFILNTLNMDVKNSEAVLNIMNNAKQHYDKCSSANNNKTASTTQHVKIAPKPVNAGPFINKGFKQRMNSATVKKNVAVLFAMAFMVTLNVGNFQNYINKTTLENAIDTSVTGPNEEPVVKTGRRLLWVPNEDEFNEQTNRTKRDTEITNMPPPPLHFLRPVNRTTGDKLNGTSAKDEPPIKRFANTASTTTTTYANTTQENMRLARNLHKWIGGNGYLNLTGTEIDNDFEDVDHFKFRSGSYMDYDLPLQAPIGTKQKRKIILDSQAQEKHRKLNIEDDHNLLDVFKPRISEEYLRLFKGIKRQDDTFYVLSFNMDHILLPASAYNKSSRPKMSLMLPAGDPSRTGDIVLMQIDCEVINTTELEIKSHMIPEKLRPSRYSANVRVNANDVANNETTGTASVAVAKSKDLPLKKAEPSVPRTYFMMGPKNQKSSPSTNSIAKGEHIVKRKPTIVKLNANDSVIGSGILNVHNSSLFSRMRKTVGS